MVVPNLNVGWRAPDGGGAEQAVQLLDLGARAWWQWGAGVAGGLEERREERGLGDGELGVCGHAGSGVVGEREGRVEGDSQGLGESMGAGDV